MANPRLCSIPDCGKKSVKRGWCTAHYKRWSRHGDPLGGRIPNGTVLAWIEEHLGYQDDECLIWPFAKVEGGYGRLNLNGKAYVASRYICECVNGSAPSPSHEAAHSCGNGHEGCVNPKHLVWKTPAQNQADKLTHGTHNRGEHHPMAKLTENDVREIFRDHRVYEKIAADFSVSIMTVSDIKRRRSWSWLDLSDGPHTRLRASANAVSRPRMSRLP